MNKEDFELRIRLMGIRYRTVLSKYLLYVTFYRPELQAQPSIDDGRDNVTIEIPIKDSLAFSTGKYHRYEEIVTVVSSMIDRPYRRGLSVHKRVRM